MILFTWLKAYSKGFESGEYGGRHAPARFSISILHSSHMMYRGIVHYDW